MAWNMRKVSLVAGGVVAGGAVCFLTGGMAAPVVGTFVGSSFMGLSGAAATSAGLAALGGGSLAAGGGGMAAGAALVTACMTGAGGLLGALGMGTVANFFRDSNKEFEKALYEQKNVAKAQEIIARQEIKIRELEEELKKEKMKSDGNSDKIQKLEQVIGKLEQAVSLRKTQVDKFRAA